MEDATLRWCLVLPVKRLAAAKSRLGAPYDLDRRDLAVAFARDTVVAALASPLVSAVVVVTVDVEVSHALRAVGAVVVDDRPGAGLNAAFAHGAHHAAEMAPRDGVGALAGDLPALRTTDLTAALELGSQHPRSFVADAEGTGTTLLLARPAQELAPAFGVGSARRHDASGAHALAAGASLRRDVDSAAQFDEALLLGVGAATMQAMHALRAG